MCTGFLDPGQQVFKLHAFSLQQDVFEIRAVNLGKLSKVKIRHDGSGPSSGWKLDKVVIQETETTTMRYVFKYERYVVTTLMLNHV